MIKDRDAYIDSFSEDIEYACSLNGENPLKYFMQKLFDNVLGIDYELNEIRRKANDEARLIELEDQTFEEYCYLRSRGLM